MKIFRLKIADRKIWRDINKLLPQLSPTAKPLSWINFRRMVKDPNTLLLVAEERKKIVGMGTIVFILTPVGLRARMEDIVVDEKYRGRGIGKTITDRILETARQKKARWLEFTSRTERKVTNRFYENLGFKKRDTNVYRLLLS